MQTFYDPTVWDRQALPGIETQATYIAVQNKRAGRAYLDKLGNVHVLIYKHVSNQ